MVYYDFGLFGVGIAFSLANIVMFLYTTAVLYTYPEMRDALYWPKLNDQ